MQVQLVKNTPKTWEMAEPILVKSPLGAVALLSIVYTLQRHSDIEGGGCEGVWGMVGGVREGRAAFTDG